MLTAQELIKKNYRSRLKQEGIPYSPCKRTEEQAQTATLLFWAAQSEIALDAGTLTQSAVEVK